jgi:hypothetical protein
MEYFTHLLCGLRNSPFLRLYHVCFTSALTPPATPRRRQPFHSDQHPPSSCRSEPYDPYLPRGGSSSNPPAQSTGGGGNAKTAAIQAQIDDTVGIMRENITKVAERGERLDSLQDKTGEFDDFDILLPLGVLCWYSGPGVVCHFIRLGFSLILFFLCRYG